jgi:hypothetical protein
MADVQLDRSAASVGSLPPVTPQTAGVTMTQSITVTVTPTVTMTGAPAGTAVPTPPSIPAVFDEVAARAGARALVADIGLLDQHFRSSVPSTSTSKATATTSLATTTTDPLPGRTAAKDLEALGNHLRDLLAAGVPTGTDGPSYVARVLSIQTFASAAIGETSTDPARAAARYGVIRTEVGVLLDQLGTGLGTTVTLPPPAPAR